MAWIENAGGPAGSARIGMVIREDGRLPFRVDQIVTSEEDEKFEVRFRGWYLTEEGESSYESDLKLPRVAQVQYLSK